jgi:hypothetical protein
MKSPALENQEQPLQYLRPKCRKIVDDVILGLKKCGEGMIPLVL